MLDDRAPFLTAWFEILDSDTPSRILDLIDEDFSFSILFSTGAGATDFAGGRAAMEGYLAQREKGTLTHHRLAAGSIGHTFPTPLTRTRSSPASPSSASASMPPRPCSRRTTRA